MKLKLGEWSFASSPFIHGNLVILNAGGAGVALDKESGATVWQSDTRTAGYASAVPFPETSGGRTEFLLFGARDFMRLDAGTGKLLWSVALSDETDHMLCRFSIAGSTASDRGAQ